MMKIKQVIDGQDVIGEVSDDTGAFMVDRGYATRVEDIPTPETHEVAPSATQTPAPKPEVTPKYEGKDKG